MGKLLKVLSFFFLVLSAIAIVLGSSLFSKREILKGRTQKLEGAIIQLANFIEAQPADSQPANYPEKDMSECTADIPDNPERSEFWKNYAANLEVQNLPTMNLADRKTELMTYYLRNPVTLKIERDESGFKMVSGKGTMQDLLDEMDKKAEEQLKRLNQTRDQMRLVREQLVTTIEDLNARKMALRQALKSKADADAKVTELEESAKQKDEQIASITEEKRQTEEQLTAEKAKGVQLQEDLAWEKEQVIRLKKQIAGLDTSASGPRVTNVDAGDKGQVVSVNQQWGFVVLELNEAFLKAILGDDLKGDCPVVEMLVRRPGPNGAFVAKIRLFQVKRDQKLGVADVLSDWQQLPLQEGDIVYN